MDLKIGKGGGSYDNPVSSFEDFKIDYGIKLGEDMDRNIASEGQNLDIEDLQDVYPQYYRVRFMIENAEQQDLTIDEFIEQSEWFKQARNENRANLQKAREVGEGEKISKFQSIENFYQILGNDMHVAALRIEDREIKSKRK